MSSHPSDFVCRRAALADVCSRSARILREIMGAGQTEISAQMQLKVLMLRRHEEELAQCTPALQPCTALQMQSERNALPAA